ncbi:MAG: dTDP-4-dehydrorhamnose 3,5-epimerase [Hyphomicrobiaceae bacterium]
MTEASLALRRLDLDGLLEIVPMRHGDDRGFFSETWNRRAFAMAGVELDFVQDNHSLSSAPGTLRGLHYQSPPHAQTKLVRVVRGAIFDVAVDIRQGSPTFGRWTGIEISEDLWNQLLVPAGFAHGFVTLRPDTEVFYKVDAFYSPDHDRSIRFDDPTIGIRWPMEAALFHISDKDRKAPTLADSDTGFFYS